MVRLLTLVAAVLGITPVAGALTGVLHTPPGYRPSGEPVPLAVELEGVGEPSLAVSAHYREVGSGRFVRVELRQGSAGQFSGEIPASVTSGIGVRYYVEVTNAAGARVFRLGSERSPLVIELFEAERLVASSASSRGLAVLVVAAGLVLGVALLARRRGFQRVAAVRRDIFWAQTLLPVAALPHSEFTAGLRELAGELLNHPIDGLRSFSQVELAARLREVRQADLAELRARADRLLPGRPRLRGIDYRLSDTDPGNMVARRTESEFVGVNAGAFGAVQSERRQRQAAERIEDSAILESIGIIDDYSDQLAQPKPEPTSIDPDWEIAPALGRPRAHA